jgi:hypothetical protein
MAGRRALNFDRLDQIMPEVDRLLAGHTRAGSWSLGQILHHLATAIRLTARADRASDAVPGLPPDRAQEVARKRFFAAGRLPEGVEVPHPSLVPPVEADERTEAGTLGRALRRLAARDGPFPPHPLLGPLTRGEWEAFHRIHCAHHLSFVVPTTADPAPPRGSGGA